MIMCTNTWSKSIITRGVSEPCQASKMERFSKIVNGRKPLRVLVTLKRYLTKGKVFQIKLIFFSQNLLSIEANFYNYFQRSHSSNT